MKLTDFLQKCLQCKIISKENPNMSKYARRVDINQKAIVEHLRAMGMSVFHLHEVGKGCPDLLAGMNGQTYLIEVKRDDKASFTPAQLEFQRTWQGSPVVRINNPQEAIDFVKNMV
jgi:Holliday junction resolvase